MNPMTRIRTIGLAIALLALTAVPARADLTAFIGANTTAEGGANAGSDYVVQRYNDAGTLLGRT